MSSSLLSGETKTATSELSYADKFSRPSYLSKSIFSNSVSLSQEFIKQNEYNFRERWRMREYKAAEQIKASIERCIKLNKDLAFSSVKNGDRKNARIYLIKRKKLQKLLPIKIKESAERFQEQPSCLHAFVRTWEHGWDPVTGWKTRKLWICDACGKDSTETRFMEEKKKADHVQYVLDPKRNKEEHADFIHSLGIRVDALIAFTYDHNCWEWETWRVVRDIVKPATRETRCRYSRSNEMKPFVGKATIFMSHCWSGKFGDLVGAACNGGSRDRYVWIDIFAVRQWPGNVADLNFRGVIQRCSSLIITVSEVDGWEKRIVNDRNQETNIWERTDEDAVSFRKKVSFMRLWCNVEIACAVKNGLPVVIKCGSVKRINHDESSIFGYTRMKDQKQYLRYLIDSVDVERSDCVNVADKIRELNIIKGMEGGFERVNQVVKGVLTGAKYVNSCVDALVCGDIQQEPKKIFSRIPVWGEKFGRIWEAACSGGRIGLVEELLKKYDKITPEPVNDTSAEWLPDNASQICMNLACSVPFSMLKRRHHCRACGILVCDDCSKKRRIVANVHRTNEVRVCDECDELMTTSKEDLYRGIDLAVEGGHTDLVKMLLEFVRARKINRHFSYLLYEALETGHLDMFKMLLKQPEANINQWHDDNLFEDGMTLLQDAIYHNRNINIVKLLLLHPGINLNQCSKDGKTLFHFAVNSNNLEIVTLLLEHPKINFKQLTKDGESFLHTAVSADCKSDKDYQIIKILLQQKDIDVNHRDNFRKTALDIAHDSELIQILCDAGALPTTDSKLLQFHKEEDEKRFQEAVEKLKNYASFRNFSIASSLQKEENEKHIQESDIKLQESIRKMQERMEKL